MPILGIEQDDAVSGDDARFAEHEYPTDVELWLESDGVVRSRSGIKIIELALRCTCSSSVCDYRAR